MVRHLDCSNCSFNGKIDPHSLTQTVDYCPGCGEEIDTEDFVKPGEKA